MIQPLQLHSNINFKSANYEDVAQAPVTEPVETVETTEAPKAENQVLSPKDKFEKAKKDVVGVLKGVNNVTNVTGGTIRGIAEGAVGLATVGVFAKNLKDNQGHLFKTLGGAITDTFKGIGNAIKFIPSIITKSPLDNVKTLMSLPKKFYSNYMKGHAGGAAIATMVGLGILAYRTILGKIHANDKNASLDHKTNRGHIK